MNTVDPTDKRAAVHPSSLLAFAAALTRAHAASVLGPSADDLRDEEFHATGAERREEEGRP